MNIQIRRSVLILEDEARVASLYEAVLGSLNYAVSSVATMEEARESVRRTVPDVLITDVRVGEHNGLQLAILFRSLSPGGQILVISGFDDPVIRREAEHVGAEFLVKPVSIDTIRRLLRQS